MLGRVENVLNFIGENTQLLSYTDLTKGHFKISSEAYNSISSDLVTNLNSYFDTLLQDNLLVKEISSKPSLGINRLGLSHMTLNNNQKFKTFKKFEKVGAYEMTKHSSIKMNSLLLIGNNN